MHISPKLIFAGQAVYTRPILSAYDLLVLGISNRWLWKCPTQRLIHHYNTHVSANHLDVGVGTGYLLDHCHFPNAKPRIGLLDLNPNALQFTAKRIARYAPTCYKQNVLEPIFLDVPKFDSIGLNYLLHCIPGSIQSKSVIFDHLKELMHPKATIFGATLLQGENLPQNTAAKILMQIYNQRGIFSNTEDHLEGLTTELNKRFKEVSVSMVGCAALFSARI